MPVRYTAPTRHRPTRPFGDVVSAGRVFRQEGNHMLIQSIKGVAFSGFLVASVAAVATVTSNASPALPDEATYFPMQAISHDLGSKAAIGYFVSADGTCQVVMMIGEKNDGDVA